jgi:hypothetical protein
MVYVPENNASAYMSSRVSAASGADSISGQVHDEINQMLRDSFIHVDRIGGPAVIGSGSAEATPLVIGSGVNDHRINFEGGSQVFTEGNGLHPQHPKKLTSFWNNITANFDVIANKWYDVQLDFNCTPSTGADVLFYMEFRSQDGNTLYFRKESLVRASGVKLASWSVPNHLAEIPDYSIYVYTESGKTISINAMAVRIKELPSFV